MHSPPNFPPVRCSCVCCFEIETVIRVVVRFALEPIAQYMLTLPAISKEEQAADVVFTNTVNAVVAGTASAAALAPTEAGAASAAGAAGAAAASTDAAGAAAGAAGATAAAAGSAPAAASASAKPAKSKKKRAAESDDEDDGKSRRKKGNSGGARKKQKKEKADSDEEDGSVDNKATVAVAAAAGIMPPPAKGMPPPQPALPAAWRTLFLQQLDIPVRRQLLQLIQCSVPERLVGGHLQAFSEKFTPQLVALNFVKICELSGITPKVRSCPSPPSFPASSSSPPAGSLCVCLVCV
jgi:hypothetical protein